MATQTSRIAGHCQCSTLRVRVKCENDDVLVLLPMAARRTLTSSMVTSGGFGMVSGRSSKLTESSGTDEVVDNDLAAFGL